MPRVDGGEGGVGGVASGDDTHHGLAWCQIGGVVRVPAAVLALRFEHGMEIHGGEHQGHRQRRTRAGMPMARQSATPRWAKSRQVRIPVSSVSSAESCTELEPAT